MKRRIVRIHPFRIYFLALIFCAIFTLLTGCAEASNYPTPETDTFQVNQVSQASEATTTPTSEPSTGIPSATMSPVNDTRAYLPTNTPPLVTNLSVVVQALDPFSGGKRRFFGPGIWNSEYKFTFAYHSQGAKLQWGSFNIATQTESLSLETKNYNYDFWPMRNLWQVADQQEVVGFFSPSGTYVLYPLWHGTTDDPPARTEVWLANTADGQLLKLQTFASVNLSIIQASWSADETKLFFSVSYEGPDEIFESDVTTGKTVPISAITDFNGVSEEIWSLSPDGDTIAVIDPNQDLLIVPLNGNKSTIVDAGNISLPSWSSNGQVLYYWWGNSQKDLKQTSELRKYDLSSGVITTLVNDLSLSQGLAEVNTVDQTHYQFETGSPYLVSADEKKLLLWGDTLFWVLLNPQ